MRYFPLIVVLMLAACTSATGGSYESYMAGRQIPFSSKNEFSLCHGYGCKNVARVPVTNAEWSKIKRAFSPPSRSAEQERKRIAIAVGMFELIAGAKTGTAEDQAGTFRKVGDKQLDCVDESTNTTSYLSILQSEGLLKFHSVKAPTMRVPIIHAGRWPHQTAVILENKTKVLYAVDSWFHDNGKDAEIIELEKWKEGWKPDSVRDLL